jgi:hypothetical protein
MKRLASLLCAGALTAATAGTLPPLQDGAGWQVVGLPKQMLPMTRYGFAGVDGQRALRIEAEGSYGNLVYELADGGTGATGRWLTWRWKLDTPLAAADLRTKAGDDAALKVCALFDLPLEALGMVERAKMRMARTVSGQWLPAATLCYVWDPSLPAGTLLPNAHSPRLRWIVARGSGTPLRTWQAERHDLHADFLRAFGDEAQVVPPLKAIALGADADNTGGRSVGWVADVALQP